jgi:hypothetical protein
VSRWGLDKAAARAFVLLRDRRYCAVAGVTSLSTVAAFALHGVGMVTTTLQTSRQLRPPRFEYGNRHKLVGLQSETVQARIRARHATILN